MGRQILERDSRPLELVHECGVSHERRHDDDIDIAMRVEQPIDEAAAKNVSGGDAAWDGDEDKHDLGVQEVHKVHKVPEVQALLEVEVRAVPICSNSYGS